MLKEVTVRTHKHVVYFGIRRGPQTFKMVQCNMQDLAIRITRVVEATKGADAHLPEGWSLCVEKGESFVMRGFQIERRQSDEYVGCKVDDGGVRACNENIKERLRQCLRTSRQLWFPKRSHTALDSDSSLSRNRVYPTKRVESCRP